MVVVPIESRDRDEPQSVARRPLPTEMTTHRYFDPSRNAEPKKILDTERLVAKQVTGGKNRYKLVIFRESTHDVNIDDDIYSSRITRPKELGIGGKLFEGDLDKVRTHLRLFERKKIELHWKQVRDDVGIREKHHLMLCPVLPAQTSVKPLDKTGLRA